MSSTSTDKLRMGLCQVSVGKDKAKNILNVRRCLEQAKDGGAQMAVLPECWNSPYSTASFPAYAEPVPAVGATLVDANTSPSTHMLVSAAVETGMWIVGGSVPERHVPQEGVEQLFAAASHGTEFQCTADMVGGAALAALDDAASVHDAWRATALVMACSAYGWAEGGRDAAAAALNAWSARALAPLSRVGARNQSAYVNEAQTDGFDVPWSELFWGSRYGRLLDVKRSVDPGGFWRCPNCVGSEL